MRCIRVEKAVMIDKSDVKINNKKINKASYDNGERGMGKGG